MIFYIPTKVFFEKGCVTTYGKAMSKLGSKAALLTGKNSSKRNGSLRDVCRVLAQEDIPYVLFDGVSPNPTIGEVIEIAKSAVLHEIDFCIGVGGGSTIDAAKAVSILLANREHIDAPEKIFFEERNAAHFPVAAIPTTCGTGSESTPFSVLVDPSKKTKRTIFSQIFPQISFVDYSYLKTAGYNLLTAPCVDALAHLIESCLAARANENNRLFAWNGLKRWGDAKNVLLSEAEFQKATDQQMEGLMAAAMFGGMSIALNGTSLPHGLANPISYEMKIPHGRAVSIFIPGFLKNYENEELVSEILSCLGFLNVNDLESFLYKVIGTLSIPQRIWENNIELMMMNTHKLSSYPYHMDREILEKYEGMLFSVKRTDS